MEKNKTDSDTNVIENTVTTANLSTPKKNEANLSTPTKIKYAGYGQITGKPTQKNNVTESLLYIEREKLDILQHWKEK